jgi:hypothetical protein
MADTSPRLALPLLAAGQAQKELFHNEALATLDALVQPCVQASGVNDPPATPSIGQSWIVGPSPTGAWAGQARAVATWSEGGWRFAGAFEGMTLWVADAMLPARYAGGVWSVGQIRATTLAIGGQQVVGARQPAIAGPSGGTTVDAEARTAITALIVALGTHGLIAI